MTGRRVRRALAGLICAVLLAAGCSGDSEPPSAHDGDSLREVAEVKDNWPHCGQFGALQAAAVGLSAADEALAAADEAMAEAGAELERLAEGADRVAIADARAALESASEALTAAQADRDSAHDAFLVAQSAALAGVEAAIGDRTLDDEDRYAAQAADDAYAAALDAAGFVSRGVAVPGRQSEAYLEAVDAATDAAQALTVEQRSVIQARIAGVERRVERARSSHEAALAAVSEREAHVQSAEDALLVAANDAIRVAEEVETELAEHAEALRAEAVAPLQEQLFRLEMIVSLTGNPLRVKLTETETHAAVKRVASAWYVNVGGAQDWGDWVGHYSALPVAWDAHIAAYGALSQRLQLLADEAGLRTQILDSYRSLLDDRAEAWTDAIQIEWAEEVRKAFGDVFAEHARAAARAVLADQVAYDGLAYRQLVRYARTSAADLVEVEDSVAAAEAEEAAWAANSQTRAFYETAVQELAQVRDSAISDGRLENKGRPTEDNIAWRGFEGSLDALSAAAQERIGSLRDEIAEVARGTRSEIQDEVAADARVVAARQALDDAKAALDAEVERQYHNRQAVTAAQSELTAAEAELRQARADSEASRPPYDRAVLAAWIAVGEAAGCR